ncbi:unnamed protein product, partial [Ectocarpus sp. 12 AP-2014]
LQVVSLEFCGACRSALSFDVHIHRQTPLSLWSPRKSHATLNKRSREACISSRVPAVQANSWVWALPMEILLPRSATELHQVPENRQPTGPSSATSPGRMGWFQKLKRLVFYSERSVNSVLWPACLQQLSFGDYFNQPIIGVAWPASLQRLSFGREFNQPIIGAVWPVSLRQLSFGPMFNQPILGVMWPVCLRRLSFSFKFNHPIVGVVWPASLQRLSLGFGFNQPVVGAVWPPSLQQLTFCGTFNQPIAGAAWPASLEQLSFGHNFNR